MSKYIKFFLLAILLFPSFLLAQIKMGGNFLIPTNHWSYDYLRELRIRGYFNDLNFSIEPFFMQDVLSELNRSLLSAKGKKAEAAPSDYFFLNQIKRLLQPYVASYETQAAAFFRISTRNHFEKKANQKIWLDTLIPCGTVGFQFGPHLSAVYSALVNNHLDENPNYMGFRQSGLAAYAKEAYISYRIPNFDFLLGRSFLRWGTGYTGTLLLSDNYRPMDQLRADFHYKWLTFSFMTASLNAFHDSTRINRYFTAHRLDIRFTKDFRFGISEVILYGGPNMAPAYSFLNPVLFYKGEVKNGPTDGNSLGSLYFDYYFKRHFHFYSEIMIDDLQLEKTGPGDLEPTEWGLLMGGEWTFMRFFMQTEYLRVTNRTYKTPYYWERYMERNQPIGYYLGDDFDHLWFRGNYWFNSALRLQVKAQYIRHGEGRIKTPFDTPWMNTPLGQNYHEPFPTGIVEKTKRFQVEMRWHPSKFGFLEWIVGRESVVNFQNRLNPNYKDWYSQLGIWFEFNHSWGF